MPIELNCLIMLYVKVGKMGRGARGLNLSSSEVSGKQISIDFRMYPRISTHWRDEGKYDSLLRLVRTYILCAGSQRAEQRTSVFIIGF